MSLLSLVAMVLILLLCYQEGFTQLLLEMVVIIIYYQFPQLPACSLYLSTELQADVTVFGH